MTTFNDKDRFYTAKLKTFSRVKVLQDKLNRGVNPYIPASESIDLPSDDDSKKKLKLAIKTSDVAMLYIVRVLTTHIGMRIIYRGKKN